jgi:hypothetical protein
MSGARILFPEFRDEQSDSLYPFADSATLLADTGFKINRDTFIDASIYAIGATPGVYIASITVGPDTITIALAAGNTAALCSTTYNPLNAPSTGELTLVDLYGRPAGLLLATKNSLTLFGGWPIGVHTFASAATEFVAAVVCPAQEAGVRGLLLNGELFTGDVWLIGDQGVVLRQTTPNVIRVDIVGDPLFKRALCLDDAGEPVAAFKPKSFLKTINGCGPDDYGNFNITVASPNIGDSILRIYPENNVLKIEAVGSRVL